MLLALPAISHSLFSIRRLPLSTQHLADSPSPTPTSHAETEMSGHRAFLLGLSESAIDFTTVPDIVDRDLKGCRVQFVDNPVVTDTNSVEPFSALQLGCLARKGIAFELFEAVKDAGDERLGQGVNPEYS